MEGRTLNLNQMMKCLTSRVTELGLDNNEEPLKAIRWEGRTIIFHSRKSTLEQSAEWLGKQQTQKPGDRRCVCSSDMGQKRLSGQRSPSPWSEDHGKAHRGQGD